MFYSTTDGQYINEGTQFVLDGITYPPQWLNQSTPEQKTQLGLVEVVATNSPANPEYYWVSEELNEATLTYINNPKDLDQTKAVAVQNTNQAAYTILLPSDWMVVKAFETSTPIPEAWNTWRASIRQQAKDQVTAINACTTVDELAALPMVEWNPSPV